MSCEQEEQKTARLGIVSLVMLILGLTFLCLKYETCQSCNKEERIMPQCHDQFLEFDDRYAQRACDVGASAEVITSPPAPKAGILCHCQAQDKADAGSQAKPESSK